MTDHTTTTPTSRRRVAAGLLAATTSILPIALWASAAPAAAAPGPISITGDECTVSFAGDGYGQLRLSITYNGRTTELLDTVMPGGSSEYGVEWLLPIGAVATFTVEGIVGGQVVASESVQRGTCESVFEETITLTATEEGPAAPGSVYDVQLLECSPDLDFAPVVSLTAGASAVIPVIPTRTYCPTPVGAPATVTSITASPSSLQAGYGGHPTVVVHAVHEADEAPPADPPVDPEPEVEPESSPSTPVEPTAPAAPAAPEAPASPEAPTPAGTQVEATADARTALPRTGVEGWLAPLGAGLAAAGSGLLRARRRFAAGS
jgi:hypothetical protein